MIDLSSAKNELILNPRLPQAARDQFEHAWRGLIEPNFQAQVGLVTSGSSGEGLGRLIVLSKQALATSAKAVNEWFRSDSSDIWMKTLPDFHVGGAGIRLRAGFSGAKVFQSKLEKWEAQAFYDELVSSKATIVSFVPTQLFDLVNLNLRAPKSVRVAFLGGGRVENGLYLRAKTMGWPVYASYGMTECCSTVAAHRMDSVSSIPRGFFALPHVKLRLNEGGFVEIQSPSLLTGQITFTDTMANFIDPKINGWFTTEDRAELASGGALKILGRATDFVKIGGEGVVVSRLEEQLERSKLEIRYGFDAALMAAVDARLGAKIVLMTTANETQAWDLIQHYNSHVAPFERIRSVHPVEQIPRSALGKLLRRQALGLVGLEPLPDL